MTELETRARSQPQPPSPLLVHGEFSDFDHVAEAIRGWDLDWRQLDRGRLDASLQQISTPSVLLSRVAFSRQFHQRGGTPPGFLTIGLVGKEVEGVNWCGRRTTAGDLLMFRSGGEYESMSPAGFRCSTVSFSADLLSYVAGPRGLAGVERLLSDSTRVVTCRPGALEDLRGKLEEVFGSAVVDPSLLSTPGLRAAVQAEIPALVLRALDSGREGGLSVSSAVRSQATRRALALIEERPRDPLTVQELCQAAAVSERTLEYAFREQFGVTPKQYLKAVRLAGARRELLHSEPEKRVADVANHWSFWHLGQFAKDYRRQFGELPSETLGRG